MYRLIEQKGVSVIVPYKEAWELYASIREEYDKNGLTNKLIKSARAVMVSSYDTKSVKRYCQQLRYYSAETQKQSAMTEYYLLGIDDYYDNKQGLSFERESFSGII